MYLGVIYCVLCSVNNLNVVTLFWHLFAKREWLIFKNNILHWSTNLRASMVERRRRRSVP